MDEPQNMQSERIQTQKATQCTISFLSNVQKEMNLKR